MAMALVGALKARAPVEAPNLNDTSEAKAMAPARIVFLSIVFSFATHSGLRSSR
jgi:hypothetical protein